MSSEAELRERVADLEGAIKNMLALSWLWIPEAIGRGQSEEVDKLYRLHDELKDIVNDPD